jgi:hypothetical protein
MAASYDVYSKHECTLNPPKGSYIQLQSRSGLASKGVIVYIGTIDPILHALYWFILDCHIPSGTASDEGNGTKCLKTLIRHHGVDVKSRKSIWTLVVGGCSSAFSTWHGELSRVKK